MGRSVLFVGGSGIISTGSVVRALEHGWEVSVLNRGRSAQRPLPAAVEHLTADIADRQAVASAVAGRDFDVVCQFRAFTPDTVRADADLWRGRTGQYVFISSASAYQTPPRHLPITESTPLRNPHWDYSRNKIACEDVLVKLWRDEAFPATIVRPSHTYDRTLCPLDGGGATLARLLSGAPVVVHGDGASLWTLTHTTDFAKAFVGLLGRPEAVGDVFHITSDEWLTWDAIVGMLADAAGTEANIVHVPSDVIAAADPEWGAGLLGDKTHSLIFDNTKVKTLVPEFVCTTPFSEGAREIIAWHTAEPDRIRVDPRQEALIAGLVERFSVR